MGGRVDRKRKRREGTNEKDIVQRDDRDGQRGVEVVETEKKGGARRWGEGARQEEGTCGPSSGGTPSGATLNAMPNAMPSDGTSNDASNDTSIDTSIGTSDASSDASSDGTRFVASAAPPASELGDVLPPSDPWVRRLESVLRNSVAPPQSKEHTRAGTARVIDALRDRHACISEGRDGRSVVAARPIVGRAYEQSFLRPAVAELNERSCSNGPMRCRATILAESRHGPCDERVFVPAEFLLPDERDDWIHDGKLPETHGPCLLCIRYAASAMYIRAHVDPSIDVVHEMASSCSSEQAALVRSLPRHATYVGVPDGYDTSSILPISDTYMNSATFAASGIARAVVLQPFPRFDATQLRFVRGTPHGSGPRVLQLNSSAMHLNETASLKRTPGDATTAVPPLGRPAPERTMVTAVAM